MRVAPFGLGLLCASALFACGSGLAFAPDTVTIHGSLVATNGLPVPKASYWPADGAQPIRGAQLGAPLPPGSFQTDAVGRFFLYGFGASYDLTFAQPSDRTDLTMVRGITRRDPVVELPTIGPTPTQSCHVDVAWGGDLPAGAKVAWFLDSAGTASVRFDSLVQVDDDLAHGLTATWHGSQATTANLNGLVYLADASGKPTSFVGNGYSYVYLKNASSAFVGLQLQTIDSSPATLTTTMPDGFALDAVNVSADHGFRSTTFAPFTIDAASLPASFTVPDFVSNRYVTSVDAHHAGELSHGVSFGTSYANQTFAIAVDLPAAPALSTPADGATDVDATTPFTFTGDGVTEVIFTPVGDGPKVRIVTTEKTVDLGMLPDVSAFVSGARFTWTVRRWPFIPTVDAFVDPNVDLRATSSATSAPRTFTWK
ncbi:MAG TPA: hypothetical protein VF407_03330 [Polyangiaceae bacterium]